MGTGKANASESLRTGRRGADHIRQLVVLGDGAPWIWNQATTLWPEATQIVDLYHAREHVHEIAGLLAETLGEELDTWVAERLAELDAGNIKALIAVARNPYPVTANALPWTRPCPVGVGTRGVRRGEAP